MKALIVREMVSEGAIAAAHGLRHPIHRLVIPEKNWLTITPYRDNLYVWHRRTDKGQVVAEVEVPDEIVRSAEQFRDAMSATKFAIVGNSDLASFFSDQA